MAMEIKGSYNDYREDYSEKFAAKQEKETEKENKAAKKEGKATETKAAETAAAEKTSKETKENRTGILTPQDEYINSEKSGARPSGLYRLEQDEKGNPRIAYDAWKKPAAPDDVSEPKTGNSKADDSKPDKNGKSQPNAAAPGKEEEQWVGSTDKVDREIRKLKEKKAQLEQQINAVSGDEEKAGKLKKELAQVENELRQKDNDTYRRQHTSFHKK